MDKNINSISLNPCPSPEVKGASGLAKTSSQWIGHRFKIIFNGLSSLLQSLIMRITALAAFMMALCCCPLSASQTNKAMKSCCIQTVTAKEAANEDIKPLVSFLMNSKAEFFISRNDPSKEQPLVHFVIGNESADLDSIISSIAYSYQLSLEGQNLNGHLYLPLLNVRREELAMRKDFIYLMNKLGIPLDSLLCIDDHVDLEGLFKNQKLRLTLVDHNALRPSLRHLSSSVEEIIDHHADEKASYPLIETGSSKKRIASVGSATTLVYEKILNKHTWSITPSIALMLLAPILLDTINLSEKTRATEQDLVAVAHLRSLADGKIPCDFYNTLVKAREDVSGLTPGMLLAKDFKEYRDGSILYGISSFQPKVNFWKEDEAELLPILKEFSTGYHLQLEFMLMFDGELKENKRKLIVYSDSEKLLKAFEQYAANDAALNSKLVLEDRSDTGSVLYYKIPTNLSRKQLQPLLRFTHLVEEAQGNGFIVETKLS